MNLREPKKKKRTKLKSQFPFPIPLDETQEWPVYTAHLTDVGSCIIEPKEISAVHSMGFFGKGSLSRSYPSFGKARYGTPPVVRNRQWLHRQEWLNEVKELNSTSSNYEVKICDIEDAKTSAQCEEENISNSKEENIGDIIEIPLNCNENKEINEVKDDIEIDEVVLDSAEEDDVCVIVNNQESDNIKNSPKTHDNKNSEEKKEEEELCELNYYDFKSDCANEDDNQHGKLLVLPDSDSDTDNYLKDIKPRIENEGFPIREALHLTFEETFFLLFGLGCLQVIHFDGSLLDINSAWLYFCKEKPDFLQKYVVYHYYRSKGWVVKPGLKYGGDFLLYKEGPPFFHASYIVIVEVADADSLIIDPLSMRSTWNSLFGLERLSETAAKEILFAQVLWPSSVPQDISTTSPEILSEFTVRELLWRRWNPKQHREDVPTEDEDSC
ncbi:tRNA-splicing endonuclease subunit Sen2 isoform X2 [Nylanderia fulva]|uniref:tRNA-splicing endonuclease subunit Sen2 isoform X2 n=1 Tax=Nylanderia fulva TaxID=613905 RepID=UPI0010FB10F8|nr:tRNA-splicing endonuclease subunit Sen2 isoform X2 [Nylanderia fulva]XP_029155908.1 tRNA-splicing endonuclease subunit Sen2 isoform X2 [Nylanderia fulva]XP_029155909.1 tRNA-splicing endonuclease subunit Sen2 isoform X2 [Nylanderia fulva]